MNKNIKIIMICLLVIACIICVFLYRQSTRQKYEVECSSAFFEANRNDFKYAVNDSVEITYGLIATDTDYTFKVEGVDEYDLSYSDTKGYVITFKMPENNVKVSVSEKNTMINEPEGNAVFEIELDENITTGFEWQYDVYPEGSVTLLGDKYVTDPYEGEPVDGLGGTHYWRFQANEYGEFEMYFEQNRGDERLNWDMVYQYKYDEDGVHLIDTYQLSDVQIDEIIISRNGGYGTRASTHPIQIVIHQDEVLLQTHLDDFDGKEGKDLVEVVQVDERDIEYFFDMVKMNLWQIKYHSNSSADIMDAACTYIIIDRMQYGGYAVDNEAFNRVVKSAYDLVWQDTIDDFRAEIAEWFNEEL